MTDKTRLTLTFTIETDQADAFMLKRALMDHPGAPLWLRDRLALALEKVVSDARDGGAWRYTVIGGRLDDEKE